MAFTVNANVRLFGKWFQVCKIVEGQRYSKRLNEKQITALLRVTCQRPEQRERDIIQVMDFVFLIDPFHMFLDFLW